MRIKKIIIILSIGFVVVFIFSFSNFENKYFQIAKNLDTFSTLFKELNIYYVHQIDPKRLIEKGIEGLMESLDPYSSYIAPEHTISFKTKTTGLYAGIGSLIGKINNKVVILDLYKGFPAYQSGLKLGDEIIFVDDVDIQGLSIPDVSKRLQGKPHTTIHLLIKREGVEQNIHFFLLREKIKLQDITYQGIIQADVGYIKLSEFRSGSGRSVEQAVILLKQKGAKKLILDIRNNPGGLLREAVNVVNIFISQGFKIVSIRGRIKKKNTSYTSLNNPVDVDIPLVVLINQGSASASEIVAGSLQDYDRAILVGHRTFGKGLVQTTRSLPYNAQLKLTTAKYYIPSGRCIQVIDYSFNKKNKIKYNEDTLNRVEYLTKRGRKVYESRGIIPDIKVDNIRLSSLTTKLVLSGQLFDYATFFCATHPRFISLAALNLYEIKYDEFMAWLKNKKFNPSSWEIDRRMEDLIETSRAEKNYADIQDDLHDIQKVIQKNEQADFIKFKDEIIGKLKEQIALHYGLIDHSVELSLHSDAGVIMALKVLQDTLKYKKILSPL